MFSQIMQFFLESLSFWYLFAEYFKAKQINFIIFRLQKEMAVGMSGSDFGFALLGGFLIALATSLHLFLKGRITGMSGIFYSLITFD